MDNPLIQLVINIILLSLAISIPIIVLILLMEFFDKYKKRKDAIKLEAQRIIVKMAEDVDQKTNTIKALDEREKELKASIYDKEQEVKKLNEKLAIDDLPLEDEDDHELPDEDVEEKMNYWQLTVNELQDIARELKIVGFSKMKKEKLIDIISNYSVEEIREIIQDDNKTG